MSTDVFVCEQVRQRQGALALSCGGVLSIKCVDVGRCGSARATCSTTSCSCGSRRCCPTRSSTCVRPLCGFPCRTLPWVRTCAAAVRRVTYTTGVCSVRVAAPPHLDFRFCCRCCCVRSELASCMQFAHKITSVTARRYSNWMFAK